MHSLPHSFILSVSVASLLSLLYYPKGCDCLSSLTVFSWAIMASFNLISSLIVLCQHHAFIPGFFCYELHRCILDSKIFTST